MPSSLPVFSLLGLALMTACGGTSSSAFDDGSGGADAGSGGAASTTGGAGAEAPAATSTGAGTTTDQTAVGPSSSAGQGGDAVSSGSGDGGAGVGSTGSGDAGSGGGGAGTSASSGSGGGDCTAITFAELDWIQTSIYSSWIDQNVDGGTPDHLEVAFFTTDYDGNPVSPSGDEAGTFDFADEPSWYDCGHAVLALVNPDDMAQATKIYYAASGTITVQPEGNDVLEGSATFALSNVVLREALIDFGNGDTEFVPGGDCLYIESYEYDHPLD